MSYNIKDILDALTAIAENRNIQVALKSSFKASCITAGSTLIGGLILAPIGLVTAGITIGAVLGGLIAYNKFQGKYKSVAVIIRDELTENQKRTLYFLVLDALKEFQGDNVTKIVSLIVVPGPVQDIVIQVLKDFIASHLHKHAIVRQ